jgi:hypothetical protein
MATRKKRTKRKASAKKRISASLTRWLRKQNPAMRIANSVRVQRLKGGAIKIIPNVGGFVDATGFHPIRSSSDYDPDRAGDDY